MAPSKRRKSTVKKGKANAMIDTTPLEKIDAEGDLTLRLTYTPPNEEHDDDDAMSGISVKAEADGASPAETEEKWSPSGNVDLLVSSKHLTLVSPILKDHIRISPELLLLPDDDLDAFRVLLNIIHGRVRQVPLKVSLSMLHNIALIVDKYQMVEVAELYVKIWIKELAQPSVENMKKDHTPSCMGDNLKDRCACG